MHPTVPEYLDALQHADRARAALDIIRARIKRVSEALADRPARFAFADEDTRDTMRPETWPEAQTIQAVLMDWRQSIDHANDQWDQIPREHHAGLRPPPARIASRETAEA